MDYGSTHFDQKTRTEDQERYNAKLLLLRISYYRYWDKQRVINLFNVIDWLMQLPEWLNDKVWQELETIEEKEIVQYIAKSLHSTQPTEVTLTLGSL